MSRAPTAEEKVQELLNVWGVGLAMASDILHVCYPAEFTILDYRAWRALWPASVEGPSRRCPRTAGDYLQYCLACRELATQSGLSLRSLDHALWAKSWEDDLLALVDEGQPLPPVGARSAAQMTPAAGLPLPAAGEPFALPPDLEQQLGRQVAGQDPAIAEVCGTLRGLRVGPPRRRPAAVLLLAGPDGTGKTTLARAMAAVLFGSDEALVRLFMSEYADQDGVMRLAGLMPCYPVPEEGRLVTALRRRPRCVVLVDELEKAHPDVLDLFLRLFEGGTLDDSCGRPVDGRGALFVLATAAGAEADAGASGLTGSLPGRPAREEELESVERVVRARFRPELLACVDRIVHLAPLSPGAVRRVLDLLLVPVQERLESGRGLRLEVTAAAREHVCVHEYDAVQGARSLERAVDGVLIGPLARYLLEGRPARESGLVLDYDGREIVVRPGE